MRLRRAKGLLRATLDAISGKAPGWRPSPQQSSSCAKLVIIASAVVALATSASPTWEATESRQLLVALDADDTRELELTLELGGGLYADTGMGALYVLAIADRAASDLTLSVRRLVPTGVDAAGPARELGMGLDAGAPALSASPSPESPDRASLHSALGCVAPDWSERAESCREVVRIRLARSSASALHVSLHVDVRLVGSAEKRPPGSFELGVEELAP